MQAFSVLAKILGTAHEFSHTLQYRDGLLRDLIPSTLQTMDWCCTKGRNDGCESRIVVILATFLPKSARVDNGNNGQLTSAT
jgi:hypothetical protein